MRTRTFLTTLALALAAACSAAPKIAVYRLGIGDKSAGLPGDKVTVQRPSQDAYGGTRRGYHVVRGAEDWNALWPEGQETSFPSTFDTASTMLLLAAPESRDVVDVKITKVVESTGYVHVWVRETIRGEGCIARPSDRIPHEGVLVPRIEKAVKFYVEEARAETCGEPPTADVQCRKMEDKDWSTKIEAQPGDLIECVMTALTRGRFAVTDRVLLLSDLPGGSTTKLAYSKGPVRASFRVDVFGTYSVRGEATDESGRKATAQVDVRAVPPKTKDAVVQLVWTGFDVSDDPDTFPRLTLAGRVGERECSLDKQPPELCEVKRFSAFTVMKLKASEERIALDVRYVDERVDKGPLACVQVWFEGVRTEEICDRTHRDPDERWSVGVLDMATGKLSEPPPADAGTDAAAPKKPPAKPK